MVYQVTQEEDRMLMEAKEIFKLLDRNIYNKIPDKIKDLVESYNGKYEFVYDKTKDLNNQKISQKTKDFIVYVYYSIASPEEREKIKENISKYEQKLKQQEKELKEKYSYEKLFENNNLKSQKIENNLSSETQEALIEIEKESFISKIINKIKSIFFKKG